MKKTWIFQGSMKYFDIEGYIQDLNEVVWSVKKYINEISQGDEVYILRAQIGSDKPSALIARAEVISDPKTIEEPEYTKKFRKISEKKSLQSRVYLHILERSRDIHEEVPKSILAYDPILKDLGLFKLAIGTNFRIQTETQVKRLKEIWDKRSDLRKFKNSQTESLEMNTKKGSNSTARGSQLESLHNDNECSQDEMTKLLERFVENSLKISQGTASLKTSEYSTKKYQGLSVRVSFGQGEFTKTPWMAFLGYKQEVQNGIYPVLIFIPSGDKNILEVCFGVSITNLPLNSWPKNIIEGLNSSKSNNYSKCFVKKEFTVTSMIDFQKNIQNILANIDEVISDFHKAFKRNEIAEGKITSSKPYTVSNIVNEGCFLPQEKLGIILNRLEEKKNIVLQGPPGTGKSWLAKKIGFALIGAKDNRRLRTVQFHPNLSYEDFVRGYRPTSEGKLSLTDGIFLEVAHNAIKNPHSKFVIVIEEINRGNPAQIFGELLTLLESGKRSPDDALELCYPDSDGERRPFYIPQNLYVIGTMNIADRSIAWLDLALRRRFAFIDLIPRFDDVWKNWVITNCGFDPGMTDKMKRRMNDLNETISKHPRLGKQFRIGHSYLTPDFKPQNVTNWFKQVVETEIGPLLQEYWFDDHAEAKNAVENLLKDLT